MASSRRGQAERGPVRAGNALLSGLPIYGRCGPRASRRKFIRARLSGKGSTSSRCRSIDHEHAGDLGLRKIMAERSGETNVVVSIPVKRSGRAVAREPAFRRWAASQGYRTLTKFDAASRA
jgi:hypothetical protein